MSDSAVTTMPTRAQGKSLRQCTTLAEAFETQEFADKLRQAAPKHLSPERLLRTMVLAVQRTPKLMQVPLMQMLGAFITCATVGLEPNTPLGHIHLIPFDKRVWNPETRKREVQGTDVNLIFGYPGLLELSYRTGLVQSVHCDVVWARDEFTFEYGTKAHVRHVPRGQHEPGESPVWAYMHAALRDGGQAFEVMPYADVLRIRNASQGYQSALFSKEQAETKGWKPPASWTEAPWVKHEIAMARKTALRAGSKWLPKSIEMASLAGAVLLDEAGDRQAIDFSRAIEGSGSVLDGGLEQIADESEQRNMAAFSIREAREEAQPQPAQQRRREPAPTAQAQPYRDPEMPHQAAALLHLIGEDGDPVGAPIADEVAFVRALRQLLQRTEPEYRESVLNHNAENIEAAEAEPRAATLLRLMETELGEDAPPPPAPQEEAAPPLVAVIPTRGRGQQDMKGYIENIQASLAEHVMDASSLTAWQAANEANYELLPRATRRAIEQTIESHRTAHRIPAPQQTDYGPMQDVTEQEEAPSPLATDISRSRDFLAQIAACTDVHQLRSMDAGAAYRAVMARWKTEKPDLHSTVLAAATARLTELSRRG